MARPPAHAHGSPGHRRHRARVRRRAGHPGHLPQVRIQGQGREGGSRPRHRERLPEVAPDAPVAHRQRGAEAGQDAGHAGEAHTEDVLERHLPGSSRRVDACGRVRRVDHVFPPDHRHAGARRGTAERQDRAKELPVVEGEEVEPAHRQPAVQQVRQPQAGQARVQGVRQDVQGAGIVRVPPVVHAAAGHAFRGWLPPGPNHKPGPPVPHDGAVARQHV
mmetsp:Transcript_13595/g.54994  ORF Transcript_13595/g.54994 Transcript_13595/m.54994 type:complete len:219 (+) Transcript_13595:550-1206(+)